MGGRGKRRVVVGCSRAGRVVKQAEIPPCHRVLVRTSEGHVLIVDDDPIVREVLERYLARDGFSVTAAADGAAAVEAFDAVRPDLVVLDLMLPRLDGFEVFRRMRARDSTAPVIMLTARGRQTERIVGLESGADDYVAKPFSPREIVARVHAVMRRTRAAEEEAPVARPDPLGFGALAIDPGAREVAVDGATVSLTPKEFDLLLFLASNPRIAFTRTDLLDQLWDVAYSGDPSTVTVHMRRLREKIEPDPSQPRWLVTVWGAGYRFEP
jgi:DNA-binding response OmpR family regulator